MFLSMSMKMKNKKQIIFLRIKKYLVKKLVTKPEKFQEKGLINKIKDLMVRNILKIQKIQQLELED